VAIVGGDEMQQSKFAFKNMETGEQALVTLDELIQAIRG
jgi:histidyl-tRNA synthetase